MKEEPLSLYSDQLRDESDDDLDDPDEEEGAAFGDEADPLARTSG